MRLGIIVVLIAALVACKPVHAAKGAKEVNVEAKIQAGLKAYKSGDVAQAIAELQDAIAAMQKSQEKGLAAFFPKAPEGWEAGKLDSQSMSAGSGEDSASYTTLSQSFTRKKDNLRVTVSLANSPHLAEVQKTMIQTYKNPEILKALNHGSKNQITMVEKIGWVGWKSVNPEGRSAETTAVNGRYVLTLHVDADDEKVLEQFWNSMDLKGLGAAQPKSDSSDK